MGTETRRVVRWIVVSALVGASAAVSVLVAMEVFPLGWSDEWNWEYFSHVFRRPVEQPWGGMEVVAAASVVWLGIVVVGWRAIDRAGRWATAALLVLLTVASGAWQLGVEDTGDVRLAKWAWAVYWEKVSGYYTVAAHGDVDRPDQFLRDYPAFLDRHGSGHIGTHPPGLFLAYRGLLDLCESSPGLTSHVVRAMPTTTLQALANLRQPPPVPHIAAIGLGALLSRLLALAAIPCAYWVGTMALRRRWAWTAAAMFATAPAPVLFAPKSDTVWPVLGLLIVGLAIRAVERASWWRAGLAGLVSFLGLFCTLAFLPVMFLAVLCGAWTAWTQTPRPHPKRLAWLVLAAAVGLLLPVALLAVLYGHNAMGVWLIVARKHAAFYNQFPRTYAVWIWLNLIELIVAVGVSVGGLAVVYLVTGWRRDPDDDAPLDRVGLPLLVLLVVLNFSGKNLSEVARLWIVFMPLVCMAAAAGARRLLGRPGWALGLLLAAQMVQTAVFHVRLNVLFQAAMP